MSIGKYPLTVPFESFICSGIDENNFQVMPIETTHTTIVASLPFHHRDPFDRLIIAQAIAEGIPVASTDETWDAYSVTRIW